MNILITGGAGFIGSHCCEKLLSLGHQVACIDNFSDFYDPEIKKVNISHIVNHPGFKLYQLDIRDRQSLDEVFSNNSIDLVIHLAAMAGVRPSIENPDLYFDVNLKGTMNLLEKMKQYKINKHIFASSSSVYGNNKKLPFSESDRVDEPISPYAYTKKAGELLCYNYYHLFDISSLCLRFFTVYGPRQRPDLAINKFTDLMLKNQKINVYGYGDTRRDYTYIDDIIHGIIQAIEYINRQKCFEIFNLGESQTIKLMDLINLLENQLQTKAILRFLPMQAGDVDCTYADISKSKAKLNYSPKISIEEGLKHFIKWKRQERGRNE